MSYIQIEIGGKLRGLKFNQGALITFRESVDLNNYAASASYAIVYAGLIGNSIVKREEFVNEDQTPITFEQVTEWVDKLDDDVLVSVIEAFKKSESYKKALDKIATKESEAQIVEVAKVYNTMMGNVPEADKKKLVTKKKPTPKNIKHKPLK